MRAHVLVALSAATLSAAPVAETGSSLPDRVMKLTRSSPWRLVESVPVRFRTYHPQGMVKVGNVLYVSSVEVRVRTKRFESPVNGHDRDTGEGAGHLFKMDLRGNLLADLPLGEGSIYHPGGIDYDGSAIWVGTAEYRPDSRSIVYRVDPDRMAATEVFRFNDHLGAIVHDTADGTLHGVSWGSRRFYSWPLERKGAHFSVDARRVRQSRNRSHYVDYQDCKYVAGRRMLCTGVSDFRRGGGPAVRLGGVDLVDLSDGHPLHQVPVPLWTRTGLPMTQNPVWIEPTTAGLRAYFMPEDDASTLYVYEVDVQ